jgi:hypothetical protein
MRWKDLEQELVKRFGPNYHNYPMSVEFYIKLRKRILEQSKEKHKELMKDE